MTAVVARRPVPDPMERTRRRAVWLTFVAGTLFVGVPMLVELVTGDAFVLMALALLAMLAALPNLHRLHAGSDGRAGAWGLRAALLGLATSVVLLVVADLAIDLVPGSVRGTAETVVVLAALVAVVAFLLGLVGLTIGMLRAALLSRPAVATFAGGLALALGAETFEQTLRGPVPVIADVLPVLGFVVTGLGLLLISRSVRQLSGS